MTRNLFYNSRVANNRRNNISSNRSSSSSNRRIGAVAIGGIEAVATEAVAVAVGG